MKITIVDSYALNPGDLSWDGFESVGEVEIYKSTKDEELISRCRDTDAVLTNKVRFTRETMERLPRLKYIGVTATGTNIIDAEAAAEMGIIVTNVPEYSTDGVAETVFSFILELSRNTAAHSEMVKRGGWQESGCFSAPRFPIQELGGKRLGIIGMGHIGARVAALGEAFGMEIVYTSRSRKEEAEEKGYSQLELTELLSTSDFVTLHVPLTAETENMIGMQELRMMKKSAFLINTARGALIDEDALYQALSEGIISGAGLDVMREEPPQKPSSLFSLPQCLITPHIAWSAKETRQRLMNAALENLVSFIIGTPKNIVRN